MGDQEDPAKQDEDPLVKEAQAAKVAAEAAKIKAETAKIEAETKALNKDKSPTIQEAVTKPLDGGVTLGDGVGLMADLLVHSSLNTAAGRVRKKLFSGSSSLNKQSRVLLTSSQDIAARDWVYHSVGKSLGDSYQNLQNITESLEVVALSERPRRGRQPKVSPPPVRRDLGLLNLQALRASGESSVSFIAPDPISVTAASVAGIVGSVVDAAALLLPEHELKSRNVTLGETPVLAAVADKLSEKVSAIGIEEFTLIDNSELLTSYQHALKARTGLANEVRRLKTEVKPELESYRDSLLNLIQNRHSTEDFLGIIGGIDRSRALRGSREDLGYAYAEEADAAEAQIVGQIRETLARERDSGRRADYPYAELDDLFFSDPTAWSRTELGRVASLIGRIDKSLETAEGALTSFDQFIKSITRPEDSEKKPDLLVALLAESLHQAGSRWTHLLHVSTEATSGEIMTSKTRIFPPKIKYVAGTQVSFLLLDLKRNSVVKAGTFPVVSTVKFRMCDMMMPTPKRIPLDFGDA